MSAASSDIFFAVQQGLQVNTVLYTKMASVSYMSVASSDLFFAVQQGLQVKYSSLSQYGVCQLHASCQGSICLKRKLINYNGKLIVD
jgi:hypothetical protein